MATIRDRPTLASQADSVNRARGRISGERYSWWGRRLSVIKITSIIPSKHKSVERR